MLFDIFHELGILSKVGRIYFCSLSVFIYQLQLKLGWSVSDNAEVNDKTMRLLERRLDRALEMEWDPLSRQGRCAEHSINLAVRH
jgi:hypothetical protein